MLTSEATLLPGVALLAADRLLYGLKMHEFVSPEKTFI
jgi:hypothetical protein